MQVDGTRADGAAAGQRNARNAGAGDQRAESEDGGAHGLDQFIGRDGIVERGGLNDVVAGRNLGHGNFGGHERQQFAHGDEVADLGNIVESDGFGGEQCRSHYR